MTCILPDASEDYEYDLEMKTMKEKPLLKTMQRKTKIKRKITKEKAKNNIKTPGGVYKHKNFFFVPFKRKTIIARNSKIRTIDGPK